MKNLFKFALAAVVLLGMTSCSDEESKTPPPGGGDGKISIRIAGTPGTRIAPGDSEVIAENESKVTSYTVYVFDYSSGNLERSVTGDPDHVTLIEGLSTATTKRVFVVANFNPGTVTNYSTLVNTARNGSLMGAEAEVASVGMVMVGESASAVTLSSTATTDVTVNLKRLLAKVTLGTITLSDESGLDPAKFVLQGVSIQRVATYANFSGGTFNPAQVQQWIGGKIGPVSAIANMEYANAISLSSPVINVPSAPFNNYFYVPENDSPTTSPTVITLQGTYDGTPYYYPIAINSVIDNVGGASTDGTLIKSNHQYRVNITIKNPIGNPGEGSTDPEPDPDTPIEAADLEVTIIVDPWELEIVQNTEI